ncbi:anthranilate phosphoribosyltransferase [Nakamurella antarctica]|uniref:Anthranilate phosphoribosyltransferase n=1 Tax=Nakamurella antarctica TaxID=1902245 RepID=A0A3G8ZKE3_9ACTN|nr:anthranilate phosphoribosyltransferase [Nakamurella antarctica]AZI57782.1 anthranilate phosphoribosyltransferase [Nakamurella antarctica]
MTVPTWPHLLQQLLGGVDLSSADTAWVMDRVMTGEATPAQVAGFAVALRAKGESAEEVAGLADGMLAHALRFEVPQRTVDIVGTGGDQSNSVNISTMAAVVVAAAGATVVKHGNRSASSTTGSADVLENLGIALTLSPRGVAECVQEVGIGFCFAAAFHPSMRYAAAPRRELGIPTFFNILGPLTNPAQPQASAIGCGNSRLAPVMAGVFAKRGSDALVFRGNDGLDELTTTTTSVIWSVLDGAVTESVFDPLALEIPRARPGDLVGSDVEFNASVARTIFAGKSGPVRDAVVLNAAAALAVHAGLSGNLEADLRAGAARACVALDTGAAQKLLADWAAASQRIFAVERPR